MAGRPGFSDDGRDPGPGRSSMQSDRRCGTDDAGGRPHRFSAALYPRRARTQYVRHDIGRALNNDGSLTVLANLGGLPFVPRQVAWSASATEGILWGGSRICDGLLAVDRSGVKALDVEINASGHAFNLKDFVSNNCTDTGNAELPAWSKDGHTIAFLASGDAVGKSDAARLDASYSLFTMDSQAWIPRQLLSNIVQPMGLAWSPDGTKVAFSATVGGNPGTWILNAGSGRLTRVAQTNHLDVAWSPDGSQLAALENETQAPADPNIHIVFDVGSIK